LSFLNLIEPPTGQISCKNYIIPLYEDEPYDNFERNFHFTF